MLKKYSLAALALAACCCTTRPAFVTISGYAQGGRWQIKYNGRTADCGRKELENGIDSILTMIDSTLSGYNAGSVLSRMNAGEKVYVNKVLAEMMKISWQAYELTDGAVDVAAGPLFDIWGFGFSKDSLPSQQTVMRIMQTCGMQRLKKVEDVGVEGSWIRASDFLKDGTEPAPKFNFNAIAQGYTADLIARYMASHGITDMLVDIGEINCRGHNAKGGGWTIGIDTPEDGNDTPGAKMSGQWQSDGGTYGVVTSGNYRKFYIKDGRKYAHTIDPRTGYPVTHNLLSATVITKTGGLEGEEALFADSPATLADIKATWYMVIGLEKSKENALESGSEVFLISSEETWTNFTPKPSQ